MQIVAVVQILKQSTRKLTREVREAVSRFSEPILKRLQAFTLTNFRSAKQMAEVYSNYRFSRKLGR